MRNPHLPNPEVSMREDGTPVSGVSGDVYFSRVDGIAETRHVFLGGIGAPEVWRGATRYRIAELGFGTGLNFLVTWKDWSDAAPPDAILEYVAIEGYPIDRESLRSILATVPELSVQSDALLAEWPPLIEGMHRLSFDNGRVRLTLIFGDVLSAMNSITGNVDAWFLDGFAPSKNPDMWSDEILSKIGKLSGKGTKAATFSVAGVVRRGLESAGFHVEKRVGFAAKRECLLAIYEEDNHNRSRLAQGARIAVIGAGVAGGCLSRALTARGLNVTLIDQANAPGDGASGNPAALLAPRLPRTRSPMGRLMASAYLHAVRFYDDLASENKGVWAGKRGAFAMARNDEEDERQHRAVAAFGLPDDVMRLVDAAEACDLSGISVPMGGLWFPEAGTLVPPVITRSLISSAAYLRANVDEIHCVDNEIKIVERSGATIGHFDTVVVAAGVGLVDLMSSYKWPLHANRGQLAYVSDIKPSLHVPVSYGGYITPPVDLGEGKRGHVVGATYARRGELPDAEWAQRRDGDDVEILENLKSHLPDVHVSDITGGRTARRATIKGYMPLAGRVAGNVFVLGGLGSRGFLTAPLLAELIADQITGAPLPLDHDIVEALDPRRFEMD